jgi:hypothetical protein
MVAVAAVSAPQPMTLRLAVPLTSVLAEHFDFRARFQWLHRKVSVPYWIVAAALISTVAGSTVTGLAVQSQRSPIAASRALAGAAVLTTAANFDSSQQGISSSNSLSLLRSGLSPQEQIFSLRGELQQLSSDLERAQRDNAILRSEFQQQSSDLTEAEANYAAADDWRKANGSDLEALQGDLDGLQGRIESDLTGMQARLASLEQAVHSAEKLANDLRKTLGMPQSSVGSGMGGVPVSDLASASDPWAMAQAEIEALQARVATLDKDLSAVTD